jgi:hypothetical protein
LLRREKEIFSQLLRYALRVHKQPGSYRRLDGYIPTRPGNIVKLDGKAVAQHQGLWQYTIGENARIPGQPKRLIVCSKNVETNEIVVVDDPYVFPVFWDVREVTHGMQKSPAIVSFDHSSGILPLDLEPPSTTRGPVRRWATGRSEDQICNAAGLGCTVAPVSSFHRTALGLANALIDPTFTAVITEVHCPCDNRSKGSQKARLQYSMLLLRIGAWAVPPLLAASTYSTLTNKSSTVGTRPLTILTFIHHLIYSILFALNLEILTGLPVCGAGLDTLS